MSARIKPWLLLACLAVLVAVAAWGIHSYRYRLVRNYQDLVGLVPQKGEQTIFYANVAALRAAGVLELFAGSVDQDYKAFITSTGFDFVRDLDSLAGASDGTQTSLLVQGKFEPDRIEQYVTTHGGTCRNAVCQTPATHSKGWASLSFVQPDVLAVSIAPGRLLKSELVSGAPHRFTQPLPSDPVWLELSPALLRNPAALPLALRIFAVSLQSAGSVLFALNRSDQPGAAFDLRLRATCANAATARTVKTQLEMQTQMLKLELAREHERPNPADLSGLLIAGSFRESGREVIGTWPIQNALLSSLR